MSESSWNGSNYFPEEILVNILVRLPARILIGFMCVCKSWNNLIGSFSFIGTHLKRNVSNNSHAFLIALHENSLERQICHTLFSNDTFKSCSKILHPLSRGLVEIHGSSNGLVCLSDVQGDLGTSVFICNLSIRKHVTLPPTTILCRACPDYVTVVAFGFHPGLNDYKVVRLVSFLGENHRIAVEVYSLSTNSWKRVDAIPPLVKTMRWKSGYGIFNGVAYWIMGKENNTTFCFVSFDTDSEAFEEFLLPDAVITGIKSMIDNYKELIAEYKGSVCLFQSGIGTVEDYIDMWVLQDKSLKKLLTVVIPGRTPYPLSISMNKELLVGYCRESGRSYMALYNLETKKVTKTGIRLAVDCYNDYYANTYVESLVLLRN